MARKRDLPTRGEVTERVEDHKLEMNQKEADLDVIAKDVETVRHTIEQLDFGGTAEGTEQLEVAIEDAENTTVDVFDHENDDLESIQADSKEYEDEIEERENTSTSDLGKISDSSAKIETKETTSELVKAKEAVLRELDFFEEQIARAKEAREKSDSIQDDLNNRVHD